ncbi:hypothetical protein EWM64_g5439 [Hericium alpestre]|uniref:Uncharacterized protein n=1 Tax=Hericium alpestre TaxID=135208 RepID=A0A4Y9ZUV2_9AGAM|nr:hypothetical protein EWM64_g5439 [Hericium alpestre]
MSKMIEKRFALNDGVIDAFANEKELLAIYDLLISPDAPYPQVCIQGIHHIGCIGHRGGFQLA